MKSVPLMIAGLIALTLGLPSCATTADKRKTAAFENLPATIEKGKSTRADVLAAIGEPDQKRLEPEGETWLYGSEQGSSSGELLGSAIGTGMSFVPYAGSAWGLLRSLDRAQQSSEPMAAVQFSRNGLVRDYAVTLPQ